MLATKSNTYTFQKNGIWYFSRRVPADLRRHYKTGRIAYSLRTRSLRQARMRAVSDAAKLDRHWYMMRMSSDDLPGKHGIVTGPIPLEACIPNRHSICLSPIASY